MNFQIITNGHDPDQALIYMWEIYNQAGVILGRYVGKAKNGAGRPVKHYKRNVSRLLSGKPYRRSNPAGYRTVHRALAQAVEQKHSIKLYFLANIDVEDDINQIEQNLIQEYQSRGQASWQLNG